MAKAYLNDIGTIIELDTLSDLTDATDIEILIKKPSGTIMTKTAYVPVGLTLGDGKIAYATVDGDFDEEGTYKAQAHVVSAISDHLGNTVTFEVKGPYL